MNRKASKFILCAAAAGAALPLYMTAPGHASKEKKAPFMGRNCAHRGLHSRDKSVPENSLEAFEQAALAGYGVELDVQLSRDGQVVVFHDDSLLRVCGVDAKVWDLDYSKLSTLKLCGSSQTIPLFTDVLKVIDGRGPIICELKTGPRNRELCRKTRDILREYKGAVCIESFDPTIVAWFRFHGREFLRGQLTNSAKDFMKDGSSFPLAFALSHLAGNFMARPQFIAHKLCEETLPVKLNYLFGAMRVCWTSHEPRNEKGKDCVIFEFYRPRKFFK